MKFLLNLLQIGLFVLVASIILSCSEKDMETISLSGDYVGLWSDNIGSVGISARLKLQGSTLSGPLFLTSGFKPGFGVQSGDNGTVSMTVTGNTIANFVYEELLITYLGTTYNNGCEGTFTGSGSITTTNTDKLVIKFQGSNCAQQLVGTITLSKQR